jgi:hypothetical protein
VFLAARTSLVIPKTSQAVLTTTVLRIRTLASCIASVFLLIALLTPLSFPKSKVIARVDTDYALALGTANDFLRAWQTQDREAGILLLTDRVKQRTSEEAIANFFSRTAGKSQSFEIARGKKLAPGRYRFPVFLFQQPATSGTRWMHPQNSSLVVVRTGGSEWSIDKLP